MTVHHARARSVWFAILAQTPIFGKPMSTRKGNMTRESAKRLIQNIKCIKHVIYA